MHKLPLLYDYVFPNQILPNGLMNQFAIINFLQSKYMLRNERNFLEQSISNKDQTLASYLYDGQLSTWPNTLSGTHLKTGFYEEYITVLEDSVYFGKSKIFNEFKKYIYPIKSTPHMDKFVGSVERGNLLNGEFFWKNISAEVLNDVRLNKAIILIDYAEENFIEKNIYDALHQSLRVSNLPKNNIILGLNSFNAQEIYESWYTEEERFLQVKNWKWVITNTSYHYESNPEQSVNIEDFIKSKNTIRKNYFLFKIRRPRKHRLTMLFKLCKDNLLEKADWSCLEKLEYNESYFNWLMNNECDSNLIHDLCNKTPKSLESESGSDYYNVSAWTDIHPKAYENSYLYLCTETFVDGEYKSLTEKVFKPIVNYQPFLLVAYPGALKLLKDLGFKTFNNFIDESYDNEQDSFKRMEMIYDELVKICKMTSEQIHNWYWSMEEILIHNKNHLLSIWKNEDIALDFIKYLLERVNNDD